MHPLSAVGEFISVIAIFVFVVSGTNAEPKAAV
jgi:hypothetical protein